MSKTGLNVYKRKDGRWEGRKKLAPNGKYSYFYGKSYREVKNKMEKASIAPLKYNSPHNMRQLCEFWLDLQKPRIKASSYAKYHNIIYSHIIPYFNDYNITEITNDDAAMFAAFLNSTLSRKTVSDILCLFKSILAFGGVTLSFKNYSENKTPHKVKTLPKSDVNKILNEAFTTRTYVATGIALTLCTGLRIGELCALKWNNINFEGGVLSITRTMQRVTAYNGERKTMVVESSPKSECSARIIPLPDNMLKLLLSIKPDDNEAYLLSGTRDFIEPRRMQYLYRKFMKKIGAEYINFHALRHTFATNCVENGFDIKCLSEILGHSTIRITLDRYVHPSLETKRANMQLISSAIFPQSTSLPLN